MKKFKVLTAILKNLWKKNRSVTYSCLTAIIIYLIVASYSFNFYNLANRANIGGCKVNVTATNTNKVDPTKDDFIDISEFAVKIKGGIWEKKPSASEIDAGKTVKFTVDLDFGCSSKRQYRIHFWLGAKEYYYYYPSESTWITKTTINLGDVNRFFK